MKNSSLDLSLTDILFVMGILKRTGELVIESGNNIGTIILYQGEILQAFSPYSKAIGDLLVEEGLISDTELIETLKVQKRNAYAPLGGLLHKMGRVSMQVIEKMVHEQIRISVKEFQSWQNSQFNFVAKDIHPYDAIKLLVNEFVPAEVLDSARKYVASDPSTIVA